MAFLLPRNIHKRLCWDAACIADVLHYVPGLNAGSIASDGPGIDRQTTSQADARLLIVCKRSTGFDAKIDKPDQQVAIPQVAVAAENLRTRSSARCQPGCFQPSAAAAGTMPGITAPW